MTKVLVAYASKYNSTAEIAQAIGKTLQEFQLFEVEVRSVELVEDITSYDAVVLGSAVYAGQWLSSAADFLTNHEQILSQRPVWLFSSGPAGEVDTEIKTKEWKFPQAITSVAARINPRSIEVFQGKLDLSRLNFLERYITRLVKAPRGDFRDWDMIRSWSLGIADALKALQLQSVQHA